MLTWQSIVFWLSLCVWAVATRLVTDTGDIPSKDSHDSSTTTTSPDCSPPEEYIDCSVVGAGWFPDTENCRRFWHCSAPDSQPEHLLCPDDQDGDPEMFDLAYGNIAEPLPFIVCLWHNMAL